MFIVGEMLKEARKNANMTQQELAERAGTKKSYISKIENAREGSFPIFYTDGGIVRYLASGSFCFIQIKIQFSAGVGQNQITPEMYKGWMNWVIFF